MKIATIVKDSAGYRVEIDNVDIKTFNEDNFIIEKEQENFGIGEVIGITGRFSEHTPND